MRKEDFVMALLEALSQQAAGPRGGRGRAEHERKGRKRTGSGIH